MSLLAYYRRWTQPEPPRPARIVLDYHDFYRLTAGMVVEARAPDGRRVEVALQDIGFEVMRAAVDMAEMLAEEKRS